MKYFDAFSGYGGFSLGIQQAYGRLHRLSGGEEQRRDGDSGIHGRDSEKPEGADRGNEAVCIGFSEIDKYASQVYSKHFPTHKPYGSITAIDASTLPDFDLFVGGFPCQAFSIAGKRGGFEDTRGTLIYDVLRIVKEKHPGLVLLENVKGLLSHDGGRTFKTIITSLAELGYAVEWQVLNAKNFGVPQNRERVFIIGHLGGFGRRAVFPLGTGDEINTQSDGQGNAYCLQAGGDKHRGTYIKQLNNPTHSNNRLYGEDGISPALNTAQGGNRQPKIPKGAKIRRLTPTECERLMGLPDGWTKIEMEQTSKIKKMLGIKKYISDTQRYKLCGNGVVVNVVEEIMKRLI